MMRQYFLISALGILLTGLIGCINLGPDYQPPDVNLDIPEFFQGDSIKSTADAVIADRWWEDFNDPELDERERVIAALEEAGWVQAKAARLLNMTPRQIAYRIQTLNIKVRQI